MGDIVVVRGPLAEILKRLFSEDRLNAFFERTPLDPTTEQNFHDALAADFPRRVSFVPSSKDLEELTAAWRQIPLDGLSYLQGNMDASNMVELAFQYRREWLLALLAGNQLAIGDLRGNMSYMGLSYLVDKGGIKRPGALSISCRTAVPQVWMICHVENPQASMHDRIATLMCPAELLPPSIEAEALEKGCHIHRMPHLSEDVLVQLTQNPAVAKTVALLLTSDNTLNPRSLAVLQRCLDPACDRAIFSMQDKHTGYAYVNFGALLKELTALAQEIVPDAWRDKDLRILQELAQDINPTESIVVLKQMLTKISSGSVQDLKQRIAALPQRPLDDLIIFLYRAGKCTLARKCLPCAPYVDAHSMHQQALARLRDLSISLQVAIQQLATSISWLKEDSDTRVQLQELFRCYQVIIDPNTSAVDRERALLILSTQHCLWSSIMTEDIIREIECSETAVSAAVSHALISSVPICEREATLTMPENFESRMREALQSLLRVSLEVPQARIRQRLGNLLTLLKPCLPWVLVLDRDGFPQITVHPDSLLQLPVMDKTKLIGVGRIHQNLDRLRAHLGQFPGPSRFTITEQFIADCWRILDPNATEEVLQQASQRLSEQYHRCLSDMRDEITGLSQAKQTLELARFNLFLAESNLSIVEFTLEVLVKEEINLERELQERLEKAKNQYELVNKNREKLAERVRMLKDGLHELARQKPAPVLARAAAADLNGSTLKMDLLVEQGSGLEVAEAAARIGETKVAPSGDQIRQKHIEQLKELGELEAQTLQLDTEWQHLNRQVRLIQESLRAQTDQVNVASSRKSIYQRGDPIKKELATRAREQINGLYAQLKTIFDYVEFMSPEQKAVFYTKLSSSPQAAADPDPMVNLSHKLISMREVLRGYLNENKGALRTKLHGLRDAREKKVVQARAVEAAATEDIASAAAASAQADPLELFISEQLPEYSVAKQRLAELEANAAAEPSTLTITQEALERARAEHAAAEAAVQALQADIEDHPNPVWLECQGVIQALLEDLKGILPWVRTDKGVVLCEPRPLHRVRSAASFHAFAAEAAAANVCCSRAREARGCRGTPNSK